MKQQRKQFCQEGKTNRNAYKAKEKDPGWVVGGGAEEEERTLDIMPHFEMTVKTTSTCMISYFIFL